MKDLSTNIFYTKKKTTCVQKTQHLLQKKLFRLFKKKTIFLLKNMYD